MTQARESRTHREARSPTPGPAAGAKGTPAALELFVEAIEDARVLLAPRTDLEPGEHAGAVVVRGRGAFSYEKRIPITARVVEGGVRTRILETRSLDVACPGARYRLELVGDTPVDSAWGLDLSERWAPRWPSSRSRYFLSDPAEPGSLEVFVGSIETGDLSPIPSGAGCPELAWTYDADSWSVDSAPLWAPPPDRDVVIWSTPVCPPDGR